MSKVQIYEAFNDSNEPLRKWLELEIDGRVVHFRYEKFLSKKETARVHKILTKTGDDASWKSLLGIMRTKLSEICAEARKAIENHDPQGKIELGSPDQKVVVIA